MASLPRTSATTRNWKPSCASYNIESRQAEAKLLPLAADRGIATLINRPYQRGALFAKSKGKPLPPLAEELGCKSWGQFYLKFIIGHPAVTCLIPATSKPHHMEDNMGANVGRVDPMLRFLFGRPE